MDRLDLTIEPIDHRILVCATSATRVLFVLVFPIAFLLFQGHNLSICIDSF